MRRFFVWLTDGTMLTVSADRCRHDRKIMTFESRADGNPRQGSDGQWREVSALRWEDVQRVEEIEA